MRVHVPIESRMTVEGRYSLEADDTADGLDLVIENRTVFIYCRRSSGKHDWDLMASISGQAMRPVACRGARLQSTPQAFRTQTSGLRQLPSKRLQRGSKSSIFRAAASQGVSSEPGSLLLPETCRTERSSTAYPKWHGTLALISMPDPWESSSWAESWKPLFWAVQSVKSNCGILSCCWEPGPHECWHLLHMSVSCSRVAQDWAVLHNLHMTACRYCSWTGKRR